jgi:hypothetical protein
VRPHQIEDVVDGVGADGCGKPVLFGGSTASLTIAPSNCRRYGFVMKKILMALGWCLVAVPLGGCFQQRDARLEYQSSAQNYKTCVLEKGIAPCEPLRVVMETDERKYNTINSAMEGTFATNNVNVQRR